MSKPEIGQRVFASATGNAARSGAKTYHGTVTKVGRKYFAVTFDDARLSYSFHIDSWREKSQFSANYLLWKSEEEYRLSFERDKLERSIKDYFRSSYGRTDLDLDQLKQIAEIIGTGSSVYALRQ